MKPIIKQLMLLVAMLLADFSASAYDFEVDGIYYNITSMSNLEVEVSSNGNFQRITNSFGSRCWKNTTPYDGTVIIPSAVNFNNRTFSVVGVGEAAFGYPKMPFNEMGTEVGASDKGVPSNITSVTLPNTIRYIGAMAFQGCNIQPINLPNSLTSIGIAAFAYTTLQEIQIPSSVENIQQSAFYHSNITSATLGENISEISDKAFQFCACLMEVFCTSANKPNGLSEKTFSGAHSALEIYVPSYAAYGFGKEYISFPKNAFQYSGQSHNIEWTNNLKSYKCEIAEVDCRTDINAGSYTKRLLAKYSNGVDFSVEIPYEYSISKAPMSLTVNDVQREYGEQNPAFTCKISGFVNGENEQTLGSSPSFDCEATQRSNVGDYRILASINAPNYEISYRYGNLSILKAPITVRVVNSEKVYGEENPLFSLSYSGLKNNETNVDWINAPDFDTEAGSQSSVGDYTVNVSGGEAQNYDVRAYTPGLLTINKRELTVKADDCERLYGEANPDFLISYIGFVNDDSKGVLLSEPHVGCAATQKSDAGTYPITVAGGNAENYKFVYEDGRLVIKPLAVGFKNVYNAVTFNDMSMSVTDKYFNCIPEITGPYSEDDFSIKINGLDKDNQYVNHDVCISGGEYAGNYALTNEASSAGKYIFTLIHKGVNPNVKADPAVCYLTIGPAYTDFEYEGPDPIEVVAGKSVKFDLSYEHDPLTHILVDIDQDEDNKCCEVGHSGWYTDWHVDGLCPGDAYVRFNMEIRKNSWGFYNYEAPVKYTKSIRIRVLEDTALEDVTCNSIEVECANRVVHITNKPAHKICNVFNMQGVLVASTIDSTIENLSPGLYVVAVGDRTFKVMMP